MSELTSILYAYHEACVNMLLRKSILNCQRTYLKLILSYTAKAMYKTYYILLLKTWKSLMWITPTFWPFFRPKSFMKSIRPLFHNRVGNASSRSVEDYTTEYLLQRLSPVRFRTPPAIRELSSLWMVFSLQSLIISAISLIFNSDFFCKSPRIMFCLSDFRTPRADFS